MRIAQRALFALVFGLLPTLALSTPAYAAGGTGESATAITVVQPVAQEGEAEEGSFAETVDGWFGRINKEMAFVIFYPIPIPGLTMNAVGTGEEIPAEVPIAVLILVLGSIFFTVRMGFPQFRAFGHAIRVIRGKYDDPDDQGEVTSFQALTAALSATVGLGNIAGVAIAVGIGGPGATFWMIVAGFLGMASKFTECTLGQMYRVKRPNGQIMGGAMYYLSNGLKEMGLGFVGKILAAIFAVICIGASLGGGNSFQANQSLGAIKQTFTFLQGNEWMYGVAMAAVVGVVIIGGIKRIATTAEKIVPTMCGIYLLACITILFMNMGAIPAAIGSIFEGAFDADAMRGGFIGVLILGFKRAAFSNEAGIGSAAIAHSAAKVPHAAREGIVALLEPFIDTIVVCSMTALVIVITGAYSNPEYADMVASNDGAALTSAAMGQELSFMPYVLSVAVLLFAFSTMISWSYYGERCWAYLFGDSSSIIYKIIFVAFVFLGAIAKPGNILDFGDLLIFGMVLPNVIGVVLLSGKVKAGLDEYLGKLKAGDYKTFK
ncbi:MAG: AGCS family alanine or glycine:cation symporter [Planctomycetota bacterium]|jgi:AGCS family alanine or glycine:cation symporter